MSKPLASQNRMDSYGPYSRFLLRTNCLLAFLANRYKPTFTWFEHELPTNILDACNCNRLFYIHRASIWMESHNKQSTVDRIDMHNVCVLCECIQIRPNKSFHRAELQNLLWQLPWENKEEILYIGIHHVQTMANIIKAQLLDVADYSHLSYVGLL